MSEKKADASPKERVVVAAVTMVAGLNLVIRPAFIYPVAAGVVATPTVGQPIMPEGFVTDTGLVGFE